MKRKPEVVRPVFCAGCGEQDLTTDNPVCDECREKGYTPDFFIRNGHLLLGPNLIDPQYFKSAFAKQMLRHGSWYFLTSSLATVLAISLGPDWVSGSLAVLVDLAIAIPLFIALSYSLVALECSLSARKLIESLGLASATGLTSCPSCGGKLGFGGEVCATCVAAGVTLADLDADRFVVIGDRLRDLQNLGRQMLSWHRRDLLRGLGQLALSYLAWLFLQGDTLQGRVSLIILFSTMGVVGQVVLTMLLSLTRTGRIRKIRKAVAS